MSLRILQVSPQCLQHMEHAGGGLQTTFESWVPPTTIFLRHRCRGQTDSLKKRQAVKWEWDQEIAGNSKLPNHLGCSFLPKFPIANTAPTVCITLSFPVTPPAPYLLVLKRSQRNRTPSGLRLSSCGRPKSHGPQGWSHGRNFPKTTQELCKPLEDWINQVVNRYLVEFVDKSKLDWKCEKKIPGL